MNKVMNPFFTLILLLTLISNSFAQDGGGDLDALVDDSKNDLLMVVGGGLAGAILGLSTLSFVEEPKENTKNIVMGASLGIIAGVAFVMYNQANKSGSALRPTNPDEELDESATPYNGSFDTKSRSRWHLENNSDYSATSRNLIEPLQFNYSFTY